MKVLVTGSSGLIGSAVVDLFCGQGHEVVGIDDDHRMQFFGAAATTSNIGKALRERHGKLFDWRTIDVRSSEDVREILAAGRPDGIVHCAGQPSHDWAATRPEIDWSINATATVGLLEAARLYCPEAAFVVCSTNKVYGDGPNRLGMVELETRFDFAGTRYAGFGIDEQFPIDHCMHSLFGVSKAAADLMVQEFGRYFGMPTCCLRLGCVTGPAHAGVEQHGFLNYLVRCHMEGRPYRVFGHRGKQVRDNIDAADVARLIEMIAACPPRAGAVYNVGGGRWHSISIIEALRTLAGITGREPDVEFVDEPRRGDHICYYSDLRAVQGDYPGWEPTKTVEAMLAEMVAAR